MKHETEELNLTEVPHGKGLYLPDGSVSIKFEKHRYRCAKGHEWESGWGKPTITFTQADCQPVVLEGCLLCLADVLRPHMVPVEELKEVEGADYLDRPVAG